jgi:hypothetical protein
VTADEYVRSVLRKYEVARGPTSPAEILGSTVAGPLRAWGNKFLRELKYSGSYAKATGVRGVADVDIFISLTSDTPETLKELYFSLYSLSTNQGWSPRQQNVSIGVTINGTRGDLVPGKVQQGYQNYHSLYMRKGDTWRQTNVDLHISTVNDSGRQEEIRALKIWRLLHKLEFPSLYLELYAIRALSGRSKNDVANNVLAVLRNIGDSLADTRIVDPANTNNVLSEELTVSEKRAVQTQAAQSAREAYWDNIIW